MVFVGVVVAQFEDDFIIVGVWWYTSVLDDQCSCGGDGLETYMGMIE